MTDEESWSADGDGTGSAFGGRLVTEAVAATTASGAIVVGTTALVVASVGAVLGVLELAVLGLAAGGSLAVASALCNRREPRWMAAGSVAVALGVLAAAYALSRPVTDATVSLSIGPFVLGVGALLAGLGSVAAVSGSLGDGQWARTVGQASATTLLPGAVVAVAVVRAFGGERDVAGPVAAAFEAGARALLAPAGPNANVGGFLALAGAAAVAVAVALRTLPVVRLVRKDRRSTVAATVGASRTWLARSGVAALALGGVLTAVPTSALHDVLTEAGVETALAAVVDQPFLRWTFAVLAAVAVLASVVTVALRRVANVDGRRVLRAVATTAPGGSFLLAAGVARPDLLVSRLRVGPAASVVDAGVDALGATALVLGVLVALVLGTTIALSGLTTAAGMGFLPNRTAAPSVAAGGVLLVAVAAGVWEGEHALATFAAVVASMVVWDVGNYGVDVTAELDGETSRVVELLHAAGSATVGVVLVALAFVALWASNALARGGAVDGPGLLGLALLMLAVVGLTSTLRA